MPAWTPYRELGHWEADIRRQIKEFQCDSCTSGLCCRQLVMVTAWEGEQIAEQLVRERLVTPRVRSELRRLANLQVNSSIQSWWQQQKPCYFLDENNRCTVYEVRPVACRKVLAVRCYGGSTMHAIDTEELDDILKKNGARAGLAPLPMQVASAIG